MGGGGVGIFAGGNFQGGGGGIFLGANFLESYFRGFFFRTPCRSNDSLVSLL